MARIGSFVPALEITPNRDAQLVARFGEFYLGDVLRWYGDRVFVIRSCEDT